MILYEYPFNERIRTYLRLEHLIGRLAQLLPRDGALDHHYALVTIFEVMDVTSRADIKSDVLKDLDRQKAHFAAFRGNPAISEASLDAVLERLDDAFTRLNAQLGKPGHELQDNEWLMSIRSRAIIPGGTCEFDLPAYHAWQYLSATARQQDLQRWVSPLVPLAESLRLLLRMIRDAGSPQKFVAPAGQYQQMLPQGRTFQLLRLRLNPALALIPEISCNRLMVSARFMRQQSDGRLHTHTDDTVFELTLCS